MQIAILNNSAKAEEKNYLMLIHQLKLEAIDEVIDGFSNREIFEIF